MASISGDSIDGAVTVGTTVAAALIYNRHTSLTGAAVAHVFGEDFQPPDRTLKANASDEEQVAFLDYLAETHQWSEQQRALSWMVHRGGWRAVRPACLAYVPESPEAARSRRHRPGTARPDRRERFEALQHEYRLKFGKTLPAKAVYVAAGVSQDAWERALAGKRVRKQGDLDKLLYGSLDELIAFIKLYNPTGL